MILPGPDLNRHSHSARLPLSEVNGELLISLLRQHQLAEEAFQLNQKLETEVARRKTVEAALHEVIVEIAQAKETAERASQAKDNFLAALSHELRTPLTPVLFIATELEQNEELPAIVREQLGVVRRNISLEAHLIDDLLDVTKIAHGKLQFRPQPCDAHRLIEYSIEFVREEAAAKNIVVQSQLEAVQSALLADATRFQQMIWNLLRNAVKFSAPGGMVSILTRQIFSATGEPWIRIEVTDSGIGIDPSRLDRIFQLFDQGDLAGNHRFGGVGLGLSIARAVAELHGGHIRAESAGPGRGATFVVELPAVRSTPSPVGVALKNDPSAITSLRLLLVDDHESTLQTLARFLRRDGHRVVTASTMAAARLAVGKESFDLLISDLGLPDGTGTDLMETLQRDFGLRGIALSGYGTEADIARSHAAGFVSHLVKPVSIDDLRAAIAITHSRG